MPRGGDRGGRRPKGSTLPNHLKRVKLNDFRLPKWIVDWLKSHPRKGSRIIEKALLAMYSKEIEAYNKEELLCDTLKNIGRN
jgi:hypothetical protein